MNQTPMFKKIQKGDIVIRAYAHSPEEWGIAIDFEKVDVDPQDLSIEDPIEYIYVTVLWPGYTTQEIDYELWTPQEAAEYAIKQHEKQSKK